MGITTAPKPVETEEKAAVETENAVDNTPTKESVTEILSKAGISTEGLDIDDILNKYQNITQYYADNNLTKDTRGLSAEDRIINYAKGLKFKATSNNYDNTLKAFIKGETDELNNDEVFVIQDVKNAKQEKNMDKWLNGFYQFATEQIETYDDAEGDGRISFEEFLAYERKEIGEELDQETIEGAKKIFDFLDQSGSGYIDKDEFAAYLWAMSSTTDKSGQNTSDDITFKEYMIANNALKDIGSGEESEVSKKFKEIFEYEGYPNFYLNK